MTVAVHILLVTPAMTKTDPQGVIRVICIGESYYPETPLPALIEGDPKVGYQAVPANLGEASFAWGGLAALKRFIRIYIPRTYEGLLESYDLVILSDFDGMLMDPKHLEWIERLVREEGGGLAKYEINYDPLVSYASGIEYWKSTSIYAAFATDLPEGKTIPVSDGGLRVEEGNPMVDLPGVRQHYLFVSGRYGYETPRQAARTVAWFKPGGEHAIVTLGYGQGRTASTVPGLDKLDSLAMKTWGFYPDFFLNQFYWLADQAVPEDVYSVNRVRKALITFADRKRLILSIMDFAEKFGASVGDLHRELSRADALLAKARGLYMDQRYLDSEEQINLCMESLKDMEQRAMGLKDRALLWIYVVEWLTVTGTSMVCGVATYMMMVRRKMYREVYVTRGGGRKQYDGSAR